MEDNRTDYAALPFEKDDVIIFFTRKISQLKEDSSHPIMLFN